MRLLICGDRNWSNRNIILKWVQNLSPEVIIEGEARGADSIARNIAIELGIEVLRYPANWNKYGRAAGVIRNTQMLKEGKPDMVLAFHDHIEISKETSNMIGQAKKIGLPVRLITSFDTGVTA